MSRPWETLDRQETRDGVFELRKRGTDDFLITLAGRVLMNSRASRSEEALGVKACTGLRDGARVLVGGLGMGLTLRAALDALPSSCEVVVAELHSVIGRWCQGPLAALNGSALLDPRVRLCIGDVADRIRETAKGELRFDAIIVDLFEGPHARTDAHRDPLYGRAAIERTWKSLAAGGVFGVWAEAPDRAFETRLRKQGFDVQTLRPGRGGLRHWIVLARRA